MKLFRLLAFGITAASLLPLNASAQLAIPAECSTTGEILRQVFKAQTKNATFLVLNDLERTRHDLLEDPNLKPLFELVRSPGLGTMSPDLRKQVRDEIAIGFYKHFEAHPPKVSVSCQRSGGSMGTPTFKTFEEPFVHAYIRRAANHAGGREEAVFLTRMAYGPGGLGDKKANYPIPACEYKTKTLERFHPNSFQTRGDSEQFLAGSFFVTALSPDRRSVSTCSNAASFDQETGETIPNWMPVCSTLSVDELIDYPYEGETPSVMTSSHAPTSDLPMLNCSVVAAGSGVGEKSSDRSDSGKGTIGGSTGGTGNVMTVAPVRGNKAH